MLVCFLSWYIPLQMTTALGTMGRLVGLLEKGFRP